MPYIDRLDEIATADCDVLRKKDAEYGGSWLRRGGVGAFMMAARKWDRLEESVRKQNYDVFKAADLDRREEGVLDDIRDLRRYLILIEAEILEHHKISASPELSAPKPNLPPADDSVFTGSIPRCPEHPYNTCNVTDGGVSRYYCRINGCQWSITLSTDGRLYYPRPLGHEPRGYDPVEDNADPPDPPDLHWNHR